MPAFPTVVVARNESNNATVLQQADQATLSVICAFPVSGQYGPGTRYLYYVLIATCVLGRGSDFLKRACLAATLLLPAIAALHGIVLASYHVEGAVDMDIYGAFQECAIGILAAPLTVRISATYFNTPGRNIIFLWTTIVLAGLISLVVEFFRVTPARCPAEGFQLGGSSCNITCDPNNGPVSWLRQGAQNNIYVITTPTVLSIGAATLCCASCCVPAVLSLISMWNKILETNWRREHGRRLESETQDSIAPGAIAASAEKMKIVNDNIRYYLKMIEIPIFGAAIIAIIVIGEKNFWSDSLYYQTEAMPSIGQWGPIAGSVLAVGGSLYGILATGGLKRKSTNDADGEGQYCTCRHGPRTSHEDLTSQGEMQQRQDTIDLDTHSNHLVLSPQDTFRTTPSMASPMSDRKLHQFDTNASSRREGLTSHDSGQADNLPIQIQSSGSRYRVAGMLGKVGKWFGTPAPDRYDQSLFRRGLASNLPEIPGEADRNANLQKTKSIYNPTRNAAGLATPLRGQRSQTGSFISITSGNPISEGVVSGPISPVTELAGFNPIPLVASPSRRATLSVPTVVFLQSLDPRSSTFSNPEVTPPGPASPTIKVSEPDEEIIQAEGDLENGLNITTGQS